ncbi:MAG: hypothetical protein JNM17_19430 [Archangium sp.]|nr:hypothetical protein [Archangium sp.]
MLSTVLALTLSAFPEFSAPEVLADLETRPRQPSVMQLLGATMAGVLIVTQERFGVPDERQLWWAPFDAPATALGLVGSAVSARRVGSRIVLLDERTAWLIELEGTTARRVELATGVAKLEFVRSTSTTEAWFFDGTQLWNSDGTVEGTTPSVRAMVAPAVETNRRIASFLTADAVSVWDAAGARTALVTDVRSLAAAGNAFIVGGLTLRNEDGQVLVNAPCVAIEGGWAQCASSLFSTDGTVTNTVLRDDGPFTILASSPTALAYAVFSNGQVRLLSGASGAPATLGSTMCSGVGAPTFLGTFLVCDHAVVPLDGSTAQVAAAPGRFRNAAFAGQLVLLQENELLVSDGTLMGTRKLALDFGITESSEPFLISANGTTALFATTNDAGVWLTDGTAEGTVRVGDQGAAWGRGALGLSRFNSLAAFDEHAKPVTIPVGVVGASGEWLIGLSNCRAFRAALDGVSVQLATEGCVTEVTVYDDAAFLRFIDGSTSLVRSPREPIPLGNDIVERIRPRCDDRRCWYAANRSGSSLMLRSVELQTGKLIDEELVTSLGQFELLFGSDEVAVYETQSPASNAISIKRRGAQVVTVPELPFPSPPRLAFAVAGNGDVYIDDEGELARIDDAGNKTRLGRCVGARLAVNGEQVWAVCENEGEPSFRLFRVVSDTMMEVQLDVFVSTPGFDGDLTWFSTLGPGSPSPMKLFVTDGMEKKELGNWSGSHFAAVRAGMVFSGSAGLDRELVVVRYQRPACGCESSGGLALTALALIISRRRRR